MDTDWHSKLASFFCKICWEKTPYGLCESCRWYWDLQLSYSKFYALLYKILGFINFEPGISKTFRPERRRVATSRAHTRRASHPCAGRPRRPRHAPPKATRRPRLALPHAPRPEAIGVLLAACTPRTAPYRLGARRGPPVRQWRPALRAPVEAGYHGRISAVTLSSPRPSRPYKCRAFSPPHTDIAAPPHHPRRRRRAAPPASHGRATAHAPPLDLIGPSRATCCPGRALTVAGAEPPWSPPLVLAVCPRRRIPRLNSGYPQALGEHVVTPHSLPGRERRRLAGIRPVPPPFHARG
jgi:hypothetical protein